MVNQPISVILELHSQSAYLRPVESRFVPMMPAPQYERDRCVTGIAGLDEILRGGIPYGSTVLVAGTCGSGKTTMCMEFLVNGAAQGEACAHFSATEPVSYTHLTLPTKA